MFCREHELRVNVDKTKYMVLHKSKSIIGNVVMEDMPLEQTENFTYLGIVLNKKMDWKPHIDHMTLKQEQLAGALLKEHRTSYTRPIAPVLKVYNHKICPAILYGAELWACGNLSSLTAVQNKFMRKLTGLPQSTPLLPLFLDLGCNFIEEVAKYRMVAFWRRLWTTPELSLFANAALEIRTKDHKAVIKWFSAVKGVLMDMGMSSLWDAPDKVVFPSKKQYKAAYWASIKEKRLSLLVNLNNLSSEFFLHKDEFRLEAYWDCIACPPDRKLFHQFRVGSIPLRAFSSRWNRENDDKYVFCEDCPETTAHMLFVCPAYSLPRKRWIKPVCLLFGTRGQAMLTGF